MPFITVDPDLCARDGLCVADCPMGILTLPKDGTPIPLEDAETLCIDCGHCVAVCPHEALIHRAMGPADCLSLESERKLEPKAAERFLRGRRSIRRYKKDPVPRETLRRLIELARYAPSGHNTQPVRWVVVEEPAKVKELAGLTIDWMRWMEANQPEIAALLHLELSIKAWEADIDTVLRSAPHVVVVHAEKNNMLAPQAATLALGYLELAAPALGLGACWAGYFHAAARSFPPLQQALGLPKGHVAQGAMMVGYPKARYFRAPARKDPQIRWA